MKQKTMKKQEQSNSEVSFFEKYFLLARLNKPSAILLLVLPAFWSFALNFKTTLNNNLLNLAYLYVAFLLGAIFTRSCGCVINDIFDRKIDKLVKRTKQRPLASNQVSLFGALVFVLILGVLSILVLLTFNKFTIFVGLSSIILIVIYPITKRITYYPQVFLGITFSWGVLMAEAALNGYLSYTTIILYIATALWVIAYDSIYAIQDYKYDKEYGIKSIVVAWGSRIPTLVGYLYTAMIFLFFIIGIIIKASFLYYLFLILVMLHFIWQVVNINMNDPKRCGVIFSYNVYTGILIWVAFLLA